MKNLELKCLIRLVLYQVTTGKLKRKTTQAWTKYYILCYNDKFKLTRCLLIKAILYSPSYFQQNLTLFHSSFHSSPFPLCPHPSTSYKMDSGRGVKLVKVKGAGELEVTTTGIQLLQSFSNPVGIISIMVLRSPVSPSWRTRSWGRRVVSRQTTRRRVSGSGPSPSRSRSRTSPAARRKARCW